MECLRWKNHNLIFFRIDADRIPGQHTRPIDKPQVGFRRRERTGRNLIGMIVGDEIDAAGPRWFLKIIGKADIGLIVGVLVDLFSAAGDRGPRSLKIEIKEIVIHPQRHRIVAYFLSDGSKEFLKLFTLKEKLMPRRIA